MQAGTATMPGNPDSEESLRRKQKELRERVDAITRDFRGGLDRDLEEQAVQLENAEVLDALLKQAIGELEEIERKLRRFER
jgi:RNA polymerase-binding transcription factor DksA